MKIYIIEKARKLIAKKRKSIFYKPRNKIKKNISGQNPMTEMCRALFKYENVKKIG